MLLPQSIFVSRQSNLRRIDIDVGEARADRISGLFTALSATDLESLTIRTISKYHLELVHQLLLRYLPRLKNLDLRCNHRLSLDELLQRQSFPEAQNLQFVTFFGVWELESAVAWVHKIGCANRLRALNLQVTGTECLDVPNDSSLPTPLYFSQLLGLGSLSLKLYDGVMDHLELMLLSCPPLHSLRLTIFDADRMISKDTVLRHSHLKYFWLEVLKIGAEQFNVINLTPEEMEARSLVDKYPFSLNDLENLPLLIELALMTPLCDINKIPPV